MVTLARTLFFLCLMGWAIGQQDLVFCPGDQASVSCDSSDRVLWSGTVFDDQCPPDNRINIQGITADSINNTYTCGSLTVTLTDFGPRTVSPGVEIMVSTTLLMFNIASNAPDDRTFACLDGTQTVISGVLSAIPIPSLSVSQDSLSAVTVNLTVGDSRCASLYFVEITQMDSSDPAPIVMNSSSPSFSVTSLNLCRNRYSVVGYVQAPSGVQGGRNPAQEIQVDLSELQGVNNVSVTMSSILEWTQLPNTLSDCINNYTISWSDGQIARSVETTTDSISATELIANGFPYCQTLAVTVTPNTPVGPVSSGSNVTDVLFQQPELLAPIVQAEFVQSGDLFLITVEWESISMAIAPTRSYGFNKVVDGECEPMFSGDMSGSMTVSGASPGDLYRVCVEFVNHDCKVSTNIIRTVPPEVFSGVQTASAGDNGFSVTVALLASPPMNMNSSDLLIYSSIDPPHDSVKSEPYPSLIQEHTVTFEGLTPGTTYTYTISVVLRNNPTTTIGLRVTGSFTIPACGTVCVVVVIVCVLVVVVGVIACLAGGFGAYKYKNRSKDTKERSKKVLGLSKSQDAEKHELTRSSPPPPDSLYADPSTIEHEAAPGTEDQYAMVDVKGKKNKKPKPAQPDALYQDPNTIEHETAASGDTYAVVDKPKRSSKKKGGPDVVPPANEGLMYAEIDMSKPPKGGARASGRQAAQQPGEYPVEYSSVDHSKL